MLEEYYVQYVTKYGLERDAYGDFTIDSTKPTTIIPCRFRVITNIQRSTNREEKHSEEAMAWFNPTTNIQENDIVQYENSYWQVQKLTEARRLGGTEILFLKCYMMSFGQLS
jgi:hypothetical protein